MISTAPPEHVPADQTRWIRLGMVTAGHCPIAIVAADTAADITSQWQQRREASWNTCDRREQEELLMTGSQQSEEVTVTWPPDPPDGEHAETDSAVMFSTELPAAAIIEGRFGDVYGMGHMQLIEVRVRLWTCMCVCHEEQDIDQADACDGDCCHDGGQ